MNYYIFLDESGSYNDFNTQYYVLAGILAKNENELNKIHAEVAKDIKKRKHKELKAASLKDNQIATFIDALVDCDVRCYALVLDKEKLIQKNHYQISELNMNNLMVIQMVLWILEDNYDIEDLIIYNDQRNMRIAEYHDLETLLNVITYDGKHTIEVLFKVSSQTPTIQFADYIANAVFGLYNKTNNAYDKVRKKRKIKIKEMLGE